MFFTDHSGGLMPSLLLEDGGTLLTEDGAELLLEGTAVFSGALMLEDGAGLLLESGARLMLEGGTSTAARYTVTLTVGG